MFRRNLVQCRGRSTTDNLAIMQIAITSYLNVIQSFTSIHSHYSTINQYSHSINSKFYIPFLFSTIAPLLLEIVACQTLHCSHSIIASIAWGYLPCVQQQEGMRPLYFESDRNEHEANLEFVS